MIDLSKSCLKCDHLERNEKNEMNCGITNKPVFFEDSCNLFEMNKELQRRKEKEISELSTKNQIDNAEISKRVWNYVIDVIAIVVLEVITGVFIVMLYGLDSGIYSLLFNDYYGRIGFVFVLNIIYYTLFEAFTGKTIGKYFTKTKVINLQGDKPGWARILLRSVCRFVPFDQISFILNDHLGWHDTLSKTLVVEEQIHPTE